MQKRDEINKLLAQAQAILEMDTPTLKSTFGEAVARMRGFSQNNPHHCYDLLNHTVQAIRGLDAFCTDLEALPLLRVAALFHDIGKPQVVRQKNGRSVFYGHAARSAEMAAPLLEKMGYTQAEVARMRFYIAHHDDFISFKLREELPAHPNPYMQEIGIRDVTKQIRRTIKDCRNTGAYVPNRADYCNLLALCMADVTAQSERVIMNGACVDSRAQKLRRMRTIRQILLQADELFTE